MIEVTKLEPLTVDLAMTHASLGDHASSGGHHGFQTLEMVSKILPLQWDGCQISGAGNIWHQCIEISMQKGQWLQSAQIIQRCGSAGAAWNAQLGLEACPLHGADFPTKKKN